MSEPTVIKDTTANPAPLGLMGFGLTTVLLNLHNAGLIGLSSMILGMGLCYGGLAQVIAGFLSGLDSEHQAAYQKNLEFF